MRWNQFVGTDTAPCGPRTFEGIRGCRGVSVAAIFGVTCGPRPGHDSLSRLIYGAAIISEMAGPACGTAAW